MSTIVGWQSNHLYNGGSGDDVMSVLPGVHDSTLAGGGGNDTIDGSLGEGIVLDGGDGADLLSGRDGEHFIGGTGFDSLVLDLTAIDSGISANLSGLGTAATVTISEASVEGVELAVIALGDGADHVTTSAKAQVGVFAGGGDDVLTGKGGIDVLAGGAGSDLVKGGAGEDILYGYGPDSIFGFSVPGVGDDSGLGRDTLQGGDGADLLIGSLGDDKLDGGAGLDTVSYDNAPGGVSVDLHQAKQRPGAAGTDVLKSIENVIGGGHDDHIVGSDGINVLSGGGGADTLEGGGDADLLSGGAGADVFVFARATDSDLGAPDVIADLGDGDLISLKGIDADTGKAGNQAFHFVDHFTGQAGEVMLVYDSHTDATTLLGDTDGNVLPDLAIVMNGDHTGFTGWVL